MPVLDAKTVVLLPFSEGFDDVNPSDLAGALDDMGGDTGSTPALAKAPVTDGLTGKARDFDTDQALVTTGDDSDALTRDVTVEVQAKLEATANGTYTLCCRGRSGSAAERRLYGLQVVITGAPTAPLYTLQAFAEEQSGLQATIPGKQFELPSGFAIFWVSRRWISTTEVRYRYGINDTDLGEVTSIDGDIEGGTAGSFTVGCRGDGSGNYENFWDGPIDWVRISDEARTFEEMRQIARSISVYEVLGYDLIRGLTPPGKRLYSTDPTSVKQRWLKNEGYALAQAMSLRAELFEDFYPDRAHSKLGDWESLAKLLPKPGDLVEARRARLLSFLRTQHGYGPAAVKLALAEAFDLDSTDVELVEYENLTQDAFATAVGDWFVQRAGNGTITIVSGELELKLASGQIGRFEGKTFCHLAQHLDGPEFSTDPFVGADATVKIPSYVVESAGDSLTGLIAYDTTDEDRQALAFGIVDGGASDQIVYRRFKDGAWEAAVVVVTTVPFIPLWLRMRYDGGGAWTLFWGNTALDVSNSLAITAGNGISSHKVIGPAVISFAETLGVTVEGHFDDWRLWQPNGRAPFHWQAYRDPALPGSPDMPGAERVIQKLKPAHTSAHAITDKACKCDDTDSLCGQTPLGA